MSDQNDIEMEEWRPVVEWEGLYEVSSLGRVRRIRKSKNRKPIGVIKTPINPRNGYVYAMLSDRPRIKNCRVQRLVAMAFLGCPPTCKHSDVNHISGDKADNRPENLEWATRSQNETHSYRVLKKQSPLKGEKSYNAKLTCEKVKEIRRRYALNNISQCALAADFGVDPSVISRVVRREIWSQVP